MDTLFTEYLNRLTLLHDGLKATIADLPQAALDWTPGPEMNSLAVLLVHVAEAERYWLATLVGGEPSERVRAEEFKAEGLTAVSLTHLLEDALAQNRAVLARLTLADLEVVRESAVHNGRSFLAAYSFLHALEHTALHLGHAQITRELWEQKQLTVGS
jgi:uncharacterized damage-inducible protein DinB